MLIISNSIKKIALSLLVVGLAIGVQSFTSAEKVVKFATAYYGNVGSNVYNRIPDGELDPDACFSNDDKACIVSSATVDTPTFTIGVNEPGDLLEETPNSDALYNFTAK